MKITMKRKVLLEEIPKVVGGLISKYWSPLKGINVEEDKKGC